MSPSRVSAFCFAAIFFLSLSFTAYAQSTAKSAANAPRIAEHPDLSARSRLEGHLPAWATGANPSGALPPAAMLHLDFILSRAPEVEAAFQQRLLDQQNRTSPFYHQWLTPAQVGALYGPNPADVDQVAGWLRAQGFQVEEIAPSRQFIRASAAADTVSASLATSFRMYTLTSGRSYRAAVAEPSIPAAFSGIVTGIGGLSEAPDESAIQMRAMAEAPPSSGVLHPLYTSSSTGNHYITPGDFAILYDVAPLYQAGVNGAGQRVAIIGRSQVNPADITNYQASVGLATKLPNVIIPPLGADPGLSSADQGEATLDVQRVMGTAPGATADLVISSNAAGGLRTAISYNVQTLLDPVMTISFGSCEASAGLANVNLYTQLFSQAAAEGISVFVSAGDSGAAGCDTHGAAPPASQIASINYICSSGFATCVGGTEFNEGANPSSYWATSNTSTRVSALSYIPEGVWNEPTSTTIPYIILSGGGGVSSYTAKPSFQTGAGVPADGFRDTPDISFSSSGHDGYFGCYAQTSGGGNCVVDPTTGLFSYEYFYGTSAAAPSMAAIAALLNQKLGAAQGNLNPLIYRLASTTPLAFHDTTIASSGVSGCTASVPSLCNNSTPSPTALTGGLAGYTLTTGYDLATGWGSLDVNRFVMAAISTGVATTTNLTGTSGNYPLAQPLNFAVTVTSTASTANPTGTVQFYANGIPLGSAAPVTVSNGATTAKYSAANTLALGTYLITAAYSGDSTFEASTSTALNLTIVTPGTTLATISFAATPTSGPTTQATTLTFAVAGFGTAPATPTGTVTISNYVGGVPSTVYLATLNGGAGSVKLNFSAGTYQLAAGYSGDAVYSSVGTTIVTVVVTPAPSVTALTGPASVNTGGTATLSATVTNLPIFATTAGVNFYDGMTLLNSVPLTKANQAVSGTASFTTAALSAGTHSFTAVYAGDANATGSTSAPLVTTVATGPGVTISPASATVSFTAGAAAGNTDVLTLTSSGGFAGPVSLNCTIAYNGGGATNYPPGCALSNASVTLPAGGSATSTLSISSTLPHDVPASGQLAFHSRALQALAFALLLGGLPLASRRSKAWRGLVLFVVAAMGLTLLSGCGGSKSPTASTPIGTTAGSYTVTVTASGGGSVTSQTTIGLVIQ